MTDVARSHIDRGFKVSSLLLGVAFAVGIVAAPVSPVEAADAVPVAAKGKDKKGKKAPQATKQIAQAKVEVKTGSGAVLKSNLNLDWGTDGNVELAAGDTKHAVGLKVVRGGESNEITVTLSYGVDGSPVIEPYTFDSSVGKREVIHIEDGAAIALTVTPTNVKVDDPNPAPPAEEPDEGGGNDKIEVGPDTEDPLGGLE